MESRLARLARSVLRPTVFPGVLGGAVAAMVAVRTWGLPPAKAATVVIFVAAAALLALQRAQPLVPAWRRWNRDAVVDGLHLLLSNGLTIEAVRAALVGLLVAASGAVSLWWGGSLWPSEAPIPVQVALALLVGDFFAYWYHRASHRWGALWRLHALHHSSERLSLFSSGRTHPLHVIGTFTLQTVPLVVAGAGAEVLAYMGLIHAVHGMLQHANIDMWHGPFNLVFSTADYHRWHHSADLAEGNTNFGNTLIVWDFVFGTRYLPRERRVPEAVGLQAVTPFPSDFLGQLASPVTWRG